MRFSLCNSDSKVVLGRVSSGGVGLAATGLAALDPTPSFGAVAFAEGVTGGLAWGGVPKVALGIGGGGFAKATGASSCCSTFVVGRAAGSRLNAAAALRVGLGSVFVAVVSA